MAILRRIKSVFSRSAFVVLLGTLAGCSLGGKDVPFLTTSSPQGTYTVNFIGKKERPVIPLVDHLVRFNVFKQDVLFLTERKLHSGDWLDISFDNLYPDQRWIDDKSLQLYREQYHRDTPLDVILVSNDTDTKIAHLRIHSIDSILLFDIEPRATSKFMVAGARMDFKSVYLEGEFNSEQKIAGYSKDFDVGTGSFIYKITVSHNGSAIEQLPNTTEMPR